MAAKLNARILAQLSPENLVAAYAGGAFPMVQRGQCLWFSPDPRGLMPLDERFHVSRRLAQTIRGGRFLCTVNRSFDRVVAACADRPEGTWISPEVQRAYARLHCLGLAHSVETWLRGPDGEPPADPSGGLYGVALGGAFFAESMFHQVTDAGKVALTFLVDHLRRRGYVLCDVQWTTENLRRFGAFDVPGKEYYRRLKEALSLECRFQ